MKWMLLLVPVMLGCAVRAGDRPGVGTPFRPLVDHHQHLLSRAGAESKLAEVPLPEALERFLRARERSWNDRLELAKLFAEDAVFSNNYASMSGRDSIAAYLGTYTGPYRLRAARYRIDGQGGEVMGFAVEADSTRKPFAFFHLALARTPAGGWRIRSESQLFPGPALDAPVTAEMLVQRLDSVGIRRAVVMSDAYYFGAGLAEPMPGEELRVREENDWTAEQVARFPARLAAFCSVNPLREYARAELDRCASSGRFRGLKIHLNAAQMKFHDPAQVDRVRRIMSAANQYRMPMVIHVRPGDTYGRAEAEVFLNQLVAAAPDVPVQIAHLWGGETFAGAALAVYADAVAARHPAARNLYFDISGAWSYSRPEDRAEIVARIRQIGTARILYASDAPPSEAWEAFRNTLPLTEAELREIAGNVAPYMR